MAPNAPPTANDITLSIVGNTVNNPIDVATSINDPDGDALTVTIQGGTPINGSATITGTVISYTPNAGYTGADSITYVVTDGTNPPVSGVISITVTAPANLPPTAEDFNISVVGNTTANPIDVSGFIDDPEGDALTVTVQNNTPFNGSVTVSGNVISYTPNTAFVGNDNIIYLVDDGTNPPVSASISVAVTPPVNQPPTADDVSITVVGNTTNNSIPLAGAINDPEGDNLTITIQGAGPLNGTASVSGTTILYSPNTGFTGNDIMTYLVDDGK